MLGLGGRLLPIPHHLRWKMEMGWGFPCRFLDQKRVLKFNENFDCFYMMKKFRKATEKSIHWLWVISSSASESPFLSSLREIGSIILGLNSMWNLFTKWKDISPNVCTNFWIFLQIWFHYSLAHCTLGSASMLCSHSFFLVRKVVQLLHTTLRKQKKKLLMETILNSF